jgi:hypothetical protein
MRSSTREAEMEERRAIAQRLFDALCVQFPDKYIALIQQPGVGRHDQPVHPRPIDAKSIAGR